MYKILIGVPMYNCENQIGKVFQDLQVFLKNFKSLFFQIEQIIFLDNHSTDNSIGRIKSLMSSDSKFSVALNTENVGLGGSHKALFSYAQKNNFSHVAIVHGDHQANATELLALIQMSERHHFRTILGSRFSHLSRRTGYSKVRTLGNCALNLIYSIFLQRPIQDLGSGLNLFCVTELDLKLIEKFDDQFTFNMDLIIYLSRSETNLLYFPISWKSENEFSNAKIYRVGWITLLKIVNWTIYREKIWKGDAKPCIFKIV